ncbi:MAG: trypsin-like serine peptidase [Planctomycetota bacterium]
METKQAKVVVSVLALFVLQLLALKGQAAELQPLSPPPRNDGCSAAIPVLEGVPYQGSTVGATGVDESSCGFFDTADVWHSFTAASSGTFRISLCGSGFDTTLAVFDECGGTELACNDDNCGIQSEVLVSLDAGQSCVIRIAGFDGETGSYSLVVETSETSVSAPSDECVNAIPVLEGVPYQGSTVGMTGVDESSCGFFDTADVWHSFTAASSGTFRISLCGSEFDTTLAVFDECGGTELACNDDNCGIQSEVFVNLDAGQSCVIRIAGFDGETGSYSLVVETSVSAPNDECVNAIPVLEGVPYQGSTAGATGVEESRCGFFDTADVWHSFTAASSGTFLFSLCGSEFDTTLAVFDECGGTELACNDDNCGHQSEVLFSLDAGQSCVIRIAGFDGETGSYSLVVETFVPPPNDECVNAIPLLEAVPYEGSTHLATGIDESSCGDNDIADVWHSYTPTNTGLVTISLCDSEFDTTLVVFDGCGGTELACTDDSCDLQSEVLISLNAGQSYIIRVAGFRGKTGRYVLTVTPNPPVLPSQPSGPGPADGTTNVPVDAALLWNYGATGTNQVASSRTVTSSPKEAITTKGIYGRDDRIEEYQVTDTDILTAGDSTAILVPRNSLIDNNDGTFSLDPFTLADEYYAIVGTPLCDDEPFRDQPTPGQCSAFLVAPNILATAGHCTGPQECSDMAVVFGFVMLDAETPVLTIDESEIYYCSEVIGRQQGDPDWGLIYLDREVTGHKPLPIRHTGVVPDGEPLLVIGHPLGVPRKYAGGATVRGNAASSYFMANLDVYGGNSGSAVFNADTLMVEGILYAGPTDFVPWSDGFCHRSSMCPDPGCGPYFFLEFVSRATEFAPVLPLFDVYLGTDPGQLELICSDSPLWSCDPGPLKTETTYYWQVVSKNCYDQAEGPIWSFTTE